MRALRSALPRAKTKVQCRRLSFIVVLASNIYAEVIARATRRSEFADLEKTRASYTHDLFALVKLSGLKPTLEAEETGAVDFSRF